MTMSTAIEITLEGIEALDDETIEQLIKLLKMLLNAMRAGSTFQDPFIRTECIDLGLDPSLLNMKELRAVINELKKINQ